MEPWALIMVVTDQAITVQEVSVEQVVPLLPFSPIEEAAMANNIKQLRRDLSDVAGKLRKLDEEERKVWREYNNGTNRRVLSTSHPAYRHAEEHEHRRLRSRLNQISKTRQKLKSRAGRLQRELRTLATTR